MQLTAEGDVRIYKTADNGSPLLVRAGGWERARDHSKATPTAGKQPAEDGAVGWATGG